MGRAGRVIPAGATGAILSCRSPSRQKPSVTSTESSTTTIALAEQHEALWLRVTALHKDSVALGAKKPDGAVPDSLRIAAEGLLYDCVPFGPHSRRSRLPVAARDMGGLAVQLGQALAGLDAWESQRSYLDPRFDCRMWRVKAGQLPIMRLKPPAGALPVHRDISELRAKVVRRIEGKRQSDFERGFAAGRSAGQGRPLAEIEAEFRETYPRLRLL